MQGYFTKKNEPRPSEHPPVVGGKTNTDYTGSLGYNSVFRAQLTTSRIGNLTQLIHTLANVCVTIHTYIRNTSRSPW